MFVNRTSIHFEPMMSRFNQIKISKREIVAKCSHGSRFKSRVHHLGFFIIQFMFLLDTMCHLVCHWIVKNNQIWQITNRYVPIPKTWCSNYLLQTLSVDHLHRTVRRDLPRYDGPRSCRLEPNVHLHVPARHLPHDKVET